MAKSSLLRKATEFLSGKSTRQEAFAKREQELKTKLAELEQQKTELMTSYDPVKGFDTKPVDKIDLEIGTAKRELEMLILSKEKAPQHEIDECIEHIEKVREETEETKAERLAEDEKLRQTVLDAKQAYLGAISKHKTLTQDVEYYKQDVDEILSKLSVEIKHEIERLRRTAQLLDRKLAEISPSMMGSITKAQQEEIDQTRQEYDETRREIQRLEKLSAPVNISISSLTTYRDSNLRPIYYINNDEL